MVELCEMYRHKVAAEVLSVAWTCYFARAFSSLQHREDKHHFDKSHMHTVYIETPKS